MYFYLMKCFPNVDKIKTIRAAIAKGEHYLSESLFIVLILQQ
jgi:hypothetical protein